MAPVYGVIPVSDQVYHISAECKVIFYGTAPAQIPAIPCILPAHQHGDRLECGQLPSEFTADEKKAGPIFVGRPSS